MGSGASNNVKPTEERKASSNSNNGGPVVVCSPARINSKVADMTKDDTPQELDRPEAKKEEQRAYKVEIADLEKQMEALQSTNLDLQEQVQALEERLLAVTSNIWHVENQQDTLQGRDQTIDERNEELRTLQRQLTVLKGKYQRKLKVVNAQLSETKHEWSLQVFELKQEISQLTEENSKLRENGEGKVVPDACSSVSDGRRSALEESCDSRMKIILELSNKVSDQDAKIIALENKLREQNKLLETERRTNSASAKRGKKSAKTAELEYNMPNTANEGSEDTTEINELKSIAEEMKKMRKAKKKVVKSGVMELGDYREASGRSRDSGISSADITADKRLNSGKTKLDRVQSATSIISYFSDDLNEEEITSSNKTFNGRNIRTHFVDDQDSWDDSDAEEKTGVHRKIELRQISALKHKRKTKKSDFEYIDNLLTDTERSHRFQGSLLN